MNELDLLDSLIIERQERALGREPGEPRKNQPKVQANDDKKSLD
jgi:hypothetical protein